MKQAMIQCPCGYAWTAGTARCRKCGSSLPADLIDAQLAAERVRAERMAKREVAICGMFEALAGLVKSATAEVNEKGAGGYHLARLSDAKDALTAARSAGIGGEG